MFDALVIGAGFAGCECAAKLSSYGRKVALFEMKPFKFSEAHESEDLCELVCSNSFKAKRLSSASGLLKQEMKLLGAICVRTADECSVGAGGALAVDKNRFSRLITEKIEKDPNITLVRREIKEIPDHPNVVVAAGPLMSEDLSAAVAHMIGDEFLSFYDAAAPIVEYESIDMSKAFFASRYDKGEPEDYINCPLTRDEYELFQKELINAQTAELHSVDKDIKVYEGCMPIEVLAKRGTDAIRYGPMKPVGLKDPKTGHRPWAVLQLRKENREGTMLNLVGFQTNLKFPEQKRVFGLIPALKEAEYIRYGVMHRNSFIDSPRILTPRQNLKNNEKIYFAGQITGVEGYMESAASGICAAIQIERRLRDMSACYFPENTLLGAFQRYITDDSRKDYQPMGASFGMLPKAESRIKNKSERYQYLAERSLDSLKKFIIEENV